MPERATQRIVLAGMTDFLQELRNEKSLGSPLDMLPKRPPPEVVCSLDLRIRTREQRDVRLHPLPRPGIRNLVDDLFQIARMEPFHVSAKPLRIQHERPRQ